jgi:hypothetical protein
VAGGSYGTHPAAHANQYTAKVCTPQRADVARGHYFNHFAGWQLVCDVTGMLEADCIRVVQVMVALSPRRA